MALETRLYDTAEYLDSPETIAAYLEIVFEEGDPSHISAALGNVARAKGMAQIANDAGLSRESLYRSLSGEGRPEFATIMKVLGALGMTLKVQPTETTA